VTHHCLPHAPGDTNVSIRHC